MPNYVNLEPSESTVNGEDTFNLSRTSGHITITNDDSSKDLEYKFDPAGVFCTLKPNETISMEFSTLTVIVKGTDVAYRIWAFA